MPDTQIPVTTTDAMLAPASETEVQLCASDYAAILRYADLVGDRKLASIAYQAINGYLYQQRKLTKWVRAQRAAHLAMNPDGTTD